MKTPDFWYTYDSFLAKLKIAALMPVSGIYATIVRWRLQHNAPEKMEVPVICVGNIVAGGAGKTPSVLAIATLLDRMGYEPHMLLRGYGGSADGPLKVDLEKHTIKEVGDEALLLARQAPTWVATDRAAGARAAAKDGAKVIVMDDGFQNPSLYKDISLLVVDGIVGFGNKHIMPAGPLREYIRDGVGRAQGAILVGKDKTDVRDVLAKISDIPVLPAQLVPAPGSEKLKDRDVVGFAGIGRPEKFRETLEELGANVVGWRSFRDHHSYNASEVWRLIDLAQDKSALVVTTEKDYVRLPEDTKKHIDVVPVSLLWEDGAHVQAFLTEALKHARTN